MMKKGNNLYLTLLGTHTAVYLKRKSGFISRGKSERA